MLLEIQARFQFFWIAASGGVPFGLLLGEEWIILSPLADAGSDRPAGKYQARIGQ